MKSSQLPGDLPEGPVLNGRSDAVNQEYSRPSSECFQAKLSRIDSIPCFSFTLILESDLARFCLKALLTLG